ncbi:MAG: rhomboid family intramembrane serine protease [Bacteroidota bacterium]|nr:rhomboid family intramembrane serine protease [Bacteroidota bacterium]MDP4196254.1 rhomboid family intramembrane serine protease [Bacteroidota bacterium]
MLFPIGDDNSDRQLFPAINYLIIILNIFVFVFLQGIGTNDRFTYAYATVPQEIISGKDIVTDDKVLYDPVSDQRFNVPGLQPTPGSVYITLITSMFMHGGIAHIFGNMIFLWVFGDNIENKLGHFRYLIFYLVCGVLASLSHVFATSALGGNMLIPSLGASGAISGVLGAYILLFPRRRVRVILFNILTVVPAIVALGIWFAFQLISGLGYLGSHEGGVAYAAHIGGFIAGVILIKIFAIGRS